MAKNKKILMELSGGVDSAVSAYLLKQQGWDVIGAMMHLYDTVNFDQEVNSAKQICHILNITFNLYNLKDTFNNYVLNYFINEYTNGKTPNPCVACNMKMKFGIMFDIAKDLGCSHLATGHYARIINENDTYSLHCGKDKSKDQSYVLFFLSEDKLSKIVFPLGNYTKDEVRQIADKENFVAAHKKDSQDICFVEGDEYAKFIKQNSNYKDKPGDVLDTQGNILGKHTGLINYTIGQRKGLSLAFGTPKYVTKIDAEKNQIVLGDKEDTLQEDVIIEDFNWINNPPSSNFKCEAKLRYRQQKKWCQASVSPKSNDKVTLHYDDKISAVTPGQFAVLYDNDKVLGGGKIKK